MYIHHIYTIYTPNAPLNTPIYTPYTPHIPPPKHPTYTPYIHPIHAFTPENNLLNRYPKGGKMKADPAAKRPKKERDMSSKPKQANTKEEIRARWRRRLALDIFQPPDANGATSAVR